jgi:hypothetical protein
MINLVNIGLITSVETEDGDLEYYLKGAEPKEARFYKTAAKTRVPPDGKAPGEGASPWAATGDGGQTKRMESERLNEEIRRLQRELDLEKTRARESTKFDSYRILGITSNASKEEVKEAYRKASKKWHPDKFERYKDPQVAEMANKRYIEIQKAYEELKKENEWI